MKALIQYIAKTLVDNPDQVVVEEITTQQTLVLELRVAKEDIGKELLIHFLLDLKNLVEQ